MQPLSQSLNPHGYTNSSPKASTAPVSFDDLWVGAEDHLKEKPETTKLLENAAQILVKFGLRLEDGRTQSQSHQQLCAFLDEEARKLEEKKWTIDDRGTSVKEQLITIFKGILKVKDMISTMASSSPPAAMACAGLTLAFTLFVQSVEHQGQLMQGLGRTAALIPRIHLMQKLASDYHSHPGFVTSNLKFQETLVFLCSKILEFHARALCYFSKSTLAQFSRDMFKRDAWGALLEDLEKFEREAHNFIALLQAAQAESEKSQWDLRFKRLESDLNTYHVWKKDSAYDERAMRLFRLLHTCPYSDRKNRNRRRVSGTCEWFTGHQTFQEWNASEGSCFLWVSAYPGCGKSVLARHLVDEVLPKPKDRTVCYFFFSDDFEDQKRATAALSSLIRQLLLAKPSLLSESILVKAETDSKWLTSSFQDLWTILMALASNPAAGEIVILIDALDECHQVDQRELIRLVTNLYLEPDKPRSLKFLMTSRPYSQIENGFRRLQTTLSAIHLNGEDGKNVEKIANEIDLVVADRIREIATEKDLESHESEWLQGQFRRGQLAETKSRTYLWATLTLDFINQTPGFTKGNVRRCLGTKIPPNVNQTYERILNRSPDHAKARLVLHIILAARRPLSLEEIAVVLALRSAHQCEEDLREEIEPPNRFMKSLRDLCGLMLYFKHEKVFLLHHTVKEFLITNETPQDTTWESSLVASESERLLAERCIWFQHVSVSDPLLNVFANYAGGYWPDHFRGFHARKEDEITKLALQLCILSTQEYPTRFTFELKLGPCAYISKPDFDTSLMVAAWLGLEPVVQILLEDTSVEIDLRSSRLNMSAFAYATRRGHFTVMERLLETGQVDVDAKDEHQQSPLFYAAQNGHDAIFKLLLKITRMDVDRQDRDMNTPLFYAAREGHKAIVELLLLTGRVDPSSECHFQQTPLLGAAENGHEGVVKLLLEFEGVVVDSKDKFQKTPFLHAAENGHQAVVQLLLKTGQVNIDSQDQHQRTPLSYSAENGHKSTVKLLRDSGVIVDSRDQYGRTALSYAAENCHHSVMQLLLETSQVDIDSQDQIQKTPLSYAAENGHEAIVKLLLDSGQVVTDSKDQYERTPLSYAAGYGHEAVVELLLDTFQVDVNTKNRFDRTPLSYAAQNGYGSVVRLLLETGQVDMDYKDYFSKQTALSYATSHGHTHVAKLLLDAGASKI